ncbi:alpha/beta hydrolase [Streptomyces sp. NPDC004111]|uniref:alpha/beta hydrolase n=1 Tax=Streptomyces sp. NPDC004111 TaxID=3364690 RepID=UPI0036C6116F
MKTTGRTALALLLSASATAATLGAGFAPTASATTAAARSGGSSSLVWRPCATAQGPVGQECAELTVPVDYARPGGATLTLAVSRVASTDAADRRGVLMVIPGGPGGSGLQRLSQKGKALQKQLGGRYDLVAFDPRGVGGSTKASCGIDAADRHMVELRSWPDADGRIDDNIARSRRIADACARNGGPLLRSFSAENEVRDLESLRIALGERKLSAWGTSYGSYVAAVYAQKFPHRTDRWVLDSVADPNPRRLEQGWMVNTSQATEDRFPDFAAWAADPARETHTDPAPGSPVENLRLAATPAEIRPLFLRLAARLDRVPRGSTTPGVPLTGNRLRQSLVNQLYSEGAFPSLARMMKAALAPAGSAAGTPVLTPDISGPLPDTDTAVVVAGMCNDTRWPSDISGYAAAVARDRARYPLTAGLPANLTPCNFWKIAPTHTPTRLTDRGPSNILITQSLRDPSTPYFGALKMREALGQRARMVTNANGGHGMYVTNGNACGDRTVTAFLRDGVRPAQDTHCPN